ncbi:Hypothetical protein NGAL_HAMBI2427_45690 [Neorhizobium galegae bv. orientalis]|nr:Hypothetical protein NGAL_HAMBI2427_45690 [Neorhizobium galegae bv. orientalis]
MLDEVPSPAPPHKGEGLHAPPHTFICNRPALEGETPGKAAANELASTSKGAGSAYPFSTGM